MSDATKLWAIHVQGPDSIIPQPDKDTADKRAAAWQASSDALMAKDPHPYDPIIKFVVVKYDGGYETWRAEIDDHGGNPEDVC